MTKRTKIISTSSQKEHFHVKIDPFNQRERQPAAATTKADVEMKETSRLTIQPGAVCLLMLAKDHRSDESQ